jgi:pimeloyl-ACP methyl ester carboxylesterase
MSNLQPGPLGGEILHSIRGVVSLPALALDWRGLPRGHGEPVWVVPGYLASDGSTWVLRRFLSGLGYRVVGWGLGRNHGQVGRLAPALAARITEARITEPGATLIGWSLGGIIAREAARRVPERVRRVITLGTPVVGGPVATRFAGRYQKQGADLAAIAEKVAQRNAVPLPVPVVGFFSRVDGVVAWEACLDPNPANDFTGVEVGVGHYALCSSRETLAQLARVLAG